MKFAVSMSVALLIWTAAQPASGVDVDFTLLTWDNTQATTELPSAVGVKPANGFAGSDWLVYTPDDVAPGAAFNPNGTMSHNLAQPPGAAGSDFTLAPSLTGMLGLSFTNTGPRTWSVSPKSQSYTGIATPIVQMNQFLVAPGDPATLNPSMNVDGVVTTGTWQDASADWAISYNLDFYLATNADGDPSPLDIDATFSDVSQDGYLIPVDQLNVVGLAAANLTSPSGFFAGDFEDYLLDEVAPRLPVDATYLLITQADPTQPQYAGPGLPINLNTTVGNTTIAYTTQAIPEPASILLCIGIASVVARRRRH